MCLAAPSLNWYWQNLSHATHLTFNIYVYIYVHIRNIIYTYLYKTCTYFTHLIKSTLSIVKTIFIWVIIDQHHYHIPSRILSICAFSEKFYSINMMCWHNHVNIFVLPFIIKGSFTVSLYDHLIGCFIDIIIFTTQCIKYSYIVNISKILGCLLQMFAENRNNSDKIVILSLKVNISPDSFKLWNHSCSRTQIPDTLFILSKCKL